MKKFKGGDVVVYIPKDIDGNVYTAEIGVVKRTTDSCIFVWYHTGDTAACTKPEDLIQLRNYQSINTEELGGDRYGIS